MNMISKARRVLERDHDLELLVNRNVVQKGDQEGFSCGIAKLPSSIVAFCIL